MYLRVCACFVLVLTYCDIIIYHDVHAPKLRSRSHQMRSRSHQLPRQWVLPRPPA